MLRARTLFCLAFVVWLSASIAGMAALWDHELRPGTAAEPPSLWPAETRLDRQASSATMLVWIHPHCPCSWASIRELERLMVHFPKQTECQVILTHPPGCDLEFVESDLTRAIRQISGLQVVIDAQQREAERFGVATSGQVLFYSAEGQLLFAGGITPGRGHEGDSAGGAELRDLFRGTNAERGEAATCSVFGCELVGPRLSKE